MTGDDACGTGYTGALCAVCSHGYFKSDGACLACSEKQQFTTPLIVFLCISVALAGLISWRMWSTICGASESSMTAKVMAMANPSKSDVFFLWLRSKIGETISRIKVIIATMQVVTSISSVISVTLPASFTSFANSLNIFNLSLTSIFPLGCDTKFNFMDTLLWTTLSPILVAGLLFVAFLVEYTYHRRQIQANKYRKKGEKAAKFNATKEKYLNYWFYLTYMILPSVTTTIFRTFICTNIDPNHEDNSGSDYYLVADMSISCESEYYWNWLAYACVMIVVYPIGVSCLYFYLLYQNRQEISSRGAPSSSPMGTGTIGDGRTSVVNPVLVSSLSASMGLVLTPATERGPPVAMSRPSETSGTSDMMRDSERESSISEAERVTISSGSLSPTAARLSFLWQSYAPAFWYWEVIETTRRIMLTAVLSVCSPGSSAQSVLAVLLALSYIRLYSYFSPYSKVDTGILAETGQFQIFFSFFTALIIQNGLLGPAWNDTLGALLILLNLCVVLLAIHFQAKSYRLDMEKAKKAVEEEKAKDQNKMKEEDGGIEVGIEKISKLGLVARRRTGIEDAPSVGNNSNYSPGKKGLDKDIVQDHGNEGMEMVEMTSRTRHQTNY